MKYRIGLTLGALAAAISSPAWATITIFSTPPFPPNPPQNVLLNSGASGTTVTGVTNISGTTVDFTGTETLTEPSSGQARIEAADGGFTSLAIALAGAQGFSSIEFNLNPVSNGTATLTFTDQFGTNFGGPFSIGGSGSNFFTAVASGGEVIRKVQIATNVDLASVAQVRLGDISAIPEPASWAMLLLGAFGAGALLRAKRRRKLVLTA